MTVWVVLNQWRGDGWGASVHAVCLDEASARRAAESRVEEKSAQGVLALVDGPDFTVESDVDLLVTVEPCEVFG